MQPRATAAGVRPPPRALSAAYKVTMQQKQASYSLATRATMQSQTSRSFAEGGQGGTDRQEKWPTVVRGVARQAWQGFLEEIDKGTVFRTTSKSIIQRGAIFGNYSDEYPFRNLSMNIAHLRNSSFLPCSQNSQTVSAPDFYFQLIAGAMLQQQNGSKENPDYTDSRRSPVLPERVSQLLQELHAEVDQRMRESSSAPAHNGQWPPRSANTQQPRSKLIDLYPNLPVVTLSEIKSQEKAFDYSKPVKFAKGVAKKSFFHVMMVEDLLEFYAQLPHFYEILCSLQDAKQQERSFACNQSTPGFGTQSVDTALAQHEISLNRPITLLNGDVAQHKMGISIHELYGVSIYLKYHVTTPDGFNFPFAKIYIDKNEALFLLQHRRFVLGEILFLQDANMAFTGKPTVAEAERDQVHRNKNIVKTVYHTEEIVTAADGTKESIISLVQLDDPWPALAPPPSSTLN